VKPCLVFHFLTLFPETVTPWMTTSIPGRAREAGLFDLQVHQLRDFAEGRHRIVDDVAYGGGGGMVLKVEPLVRAVEHIRARAEGERITTIAFSPGGERLSQTLVDRLGPTAGGAPHHLILVCGHYEGVDQRFMEGWVDLEVSLGDFVVSGGELPALVLSDALVRQLDGALGNAQGAVTESFRLLDPESGQPLIEYPQYTRPSVYQGREVPEVLLSGNHGEIASWRLHRSRDRTRSRTPGLGPDHPV